MTGYKEDGLKEALPRARIERPHPWLNPSIVGTVRHLRGKDVEIIGSDVSRTGFHFVLGRTIGGSIIRLLPQPGDILPPTSFEIRVKEFHYTPTPIQAPLFFAITLDESENPIKDDERFDNSLAAAKRAAFLDYNSANPRSAFVMCERLPTGKRPKGAMSLPMYVSYRPRWS